MNSSWGHCYLTLIGFDSWETAKRTWAFLSVNLQSASLGTGNRNLTSKLREKLLLQKRYTIVFWIIPLAMRVREKIKDYKKVITKGCIPGFPNSQFNSDHLKHWCILWFLSGRTDIRHQNIFTVWKKEELKKKQTHNNSLKLPFDFFSPGSI